MKIQETIAKETRGIVHSFVAGIVIAVVSAIALGKQDPSDINKESANGK